MVCTRCGVSMDDKAGFCPSCGHPVEMDGGQGFRPSQKEEGAGPRLGPGWGTRHASWSRLPAYLVDVICLSVLLALLAGVPSSAHGAGGGLTSLVWAVASWLYFALLESSRFQATPGKRLMGLVVTDLEGRRISFGRATGRHFAKLLSGMLLMIGYAMILFTKKRQGLHDLLAGTQVTFR